MPLLLHKSLNFHADFLAFVANIFFCLRNYTATIPKATFHCASLLFKTFNKFPPPISIVSKPIVNFSHQWFQSNRLAEGKQQFLRATCCCTFICYMCASLATFKSYWIGGCRIRYSDLFNRMMGRSSNLDLTKANIIGAFMRFPITGTWLQSFSDFSHYWLVNVSIISVQTSNCVIWPSKCQKNLD